MKTGSETARCLVASIPKSGTYFLARFLEECGLENSHLHIARGNAVRYDPDATETGRRHPERFRIHDDTSAFLEEIGEGQFALTHLGPGDLLPLSAMRGIRVVFLHRDLRDCLPSHCRWTTRSGRSYREGQQWRTLEDGPAKLAAYLDEFGEPIFEECLACAEWMHHIDSGVVRVSYEQLMGDHGEASRLAGLRSIAGAAGADLSNDALLAALENAQSAKTLTSSGRRSRGEEWFDGEVERRFRELGFGALNEGLGYESPVSDLDSGTVRELRASIGVAPREVPRCPLCEGTSFFPLRVGDRHDLKLKTAMCSDCGMAMLRPRPAAEWFDRLYRQFYWPVYIGGNISADDLFVQDQCEKRARQILDGFLNALPGPPASYLDVACGMGGMASEFARRHPESRVVGVECSDFAVDFCTRRHGFEVEHASWAALSDAKVPGPFELITCVHALEHTFDPVDFCRRIERRLADDGHVYLEVPTLMHPVAGNRDYFHVAHTLYFTEHSLRNLCLRAGLEPVRSWRGLAEMWDWGIGVLARKRPGGPVAPEDLPRPTEEYFFAVNRFVQGDWERRFREQEGILREKEAQCRHERGERIRSHRVMGLGARLNRIRKSLTGRRKTG